MWKLLCCGALVLASTGVAQSTHLENLKQLTSGGAQNAEAYWSPDGKRLIFQSTRDGHECDQIYVMNGDGSDQHMVSTGKGVTTCGYFLGDATNPLCVDARGWGAVSRRRDRSKGYVWAVYPEFDIYLATDAGRLLKKLTVPPDMTRKAR